MHSHLILQVVDEKLSLILRGHYRKEGMIQLFERSSDLHARLPVFYRVIPQIALGVRVNKLALHLRRLLIIAREYLDELYEVICVAHYNLHHVDDTVAVEQRSSVHHVACLFREVILESYKGRSDKLAPPLRVVLNVLYRLEY